MTQTTKKYVEGTLPYLVGSKRPLFPGANNHICRGYSFSSGVDAHTFREYIIQRPRPSFNAAQKNNTNGVLGARRGQMFKFRHQTWTHSGAGDTVTHDIYKCYRNKEELNIARQIRCKSNQFSCLDLNINKHSKHMGGHIYYEVGCFYQGDSKKFVVPLGDRVRCL